MLWTPVIEFVTQVNCRCCAYFSADASGFFKTMMIESPRMNILLMNRSRLTGFCFFLPFPVLGVSVHISFTFSKTMLQCLKIRRNVRVHSTIRTIHECANLVISQTSLVHNVQILQHMNLSCFQEVYR